MLSVESLGKRIPKEQKQSFAISQFSHFVYCNGTPGTIVAHNFVDGLVKNTFRLLKIPEGEIHKLQMPTSKAYVMKNPINSKKLQDINKVMQYIPTEHVEFYKDIMTWPTTDCEHDPD